MTKERGTGLAGVSASRERSMAKDDLDLLMDAVSEHMDIAHQSGCTVREILTTMMQAVALFLVSEMPGEQALGLMRAECDLLQARMPEAPGSRH